MQAQDTLTLPDLSLEPLKISSVHQGGFGFVYIAQDRDGTSYALKTLHDNGGENLNELYDEAIKSAKIHPHPNILSPLGTTSYQKKTYIVMPALERSLRSYMRDMKTREQIVEILRQIADGLHHLHDKCNLLHLDLKPENVLQDKRGKFLLSDFGLSKALPSPAELLQRQRISNAPIAGTVAYMSPEHFTTRVLSEKSDIFSFGVIMYELLTGRHPFQESTLQRIAHSILTNRPDFELSERLRLPKTIKSICRACLCKEPNNRPTSKEIIAALGGGSTITYAKNYMNEKSELSVAQMLADAGNLTAAQQSLDRVLSINPFSFTALSLYAQVAFKTGNNKLASLYADKAISAAVWSDSPSSNLQQALVSLSYYYLTIDPSKTITYANEVIKVNPNDWQALGNIAEACRVLGDSRSSNDLLQKGLEACLQAMILSPDDLKLKITYGGLLLGMGDYERLNPLVVELANKHAHDEMHVRFLLIRTLISTGQHSEADRWLEPMRQHEELSPMIRQAEREKADFEKEK